MGSGVRRSTLTLLGMVLLGSGLLVAQPPPEVPPFRRGDPVGEPPPVPSAEQPAENAPAARAPSAEPEVLGRGPIHEGYAQPGASAPKASPVVPKQPPQPINEVPPEEKPEGDNVVWVPGYWAWDEDRSDFLWVSGFWRVVPPGRKWVPGYWAEADGGWRWVSGLWADARQPELPYLAPPPENLDTGPSVPPPDEGYSYVPGIWMNRDDSWLWRPGFWCPPQPGWVYCPPRYCWTPRGCLFVSGFWDRPLEGRGVLFAPVAFSGGGCFAPGFAFTPRFCLGANGLLGSLWIGPGGGYAFGDFYGARHARLGFQPWLAYGPRQADPLYGYYRGINRGNPGWRAGLVNTYNGRTRGTLPAPARTLAAARQTPNAPSLLQPLSSYRNDTLRLTRGNDPTGGPRTNLGAAYRQASIDRQTAESRRPGATSRPAALSLAGVPDLPANAANRVRSSSLSPRATGSPVPSAGRSPVPSSARPREITNPSGRTPAPGEAIRGMNRPEGTPGRSSPYALSPSDLRRSRGEDPPARSSPPTFRGSRPDDRVPAPERAMRPRSEDDGAPLRFTPRSGSISRSVAPPPTPRPTVPTPTLPRYTPPSIPAPRAAPAVLPRAAPAAPSMPRFSAPAAPRFSAPSPPRGGRSSRGMAAPARPQPRTARR